MARRARWFVTVKPKRHARIAGFLLMPAWLGLAAPIEADRLHYRYDGLGRLTRVCNALPGDGERTDYTLDPADNRSSYSNIKTDGLLVHDSGWSSADGRFTLWFQSDGNLVLYRNSDGRGLWASNTAGSGANYAYFQSDGNLVLYSSSGSVWSSGTYSFPCARLAVQNDGNTVIYSMDGQGVWATNTGGQ